MVSLVYSRHESTRQLHILMKKPKHPEYALCSKRLESFKKWPSHLGIKLETFAEAGFIYTGELRTETADPRQMQIMIFIPFTFIYIFIYLYFLFYQKFLFIGTISTTVRFCRTFSLFKFFSIIALHCKGEQNFNIFGMCSWDFMILYAIQLTSACTCWMNFLLVVLKPQSPPCN